jgi:hypothetical protein
MKTKLTSLSRSTTVSAKGMYGAENKLQHGIPICGEAVKSDVLKREVKKHGELAAIKEQRLIFNYSLVEHFWKKKHNHIDPHGRSA